MKLVCLTILVCLGLVARPLLPLEEEAKAILEKAIKVQQTTTFSAIIASGAGEMKVEQKIIQFQNSDGIVSRRIETRNAVDGELSLHLENERGKYDVFPEQKKVIKLNFSREDEEPNYFEFALFEMKHGQISGHSCYIITSKIEDSPDVFAAFSDVVKSTAQVPMSNSHCKQIFLKVFPAVSVYYIGKDDFFIYSSEHFTFDGKSKGRVVFSNVNFHPSINASIFEIPPDYSVEYVNNGKDYIAVRHKIGVAISNERHKRQHSVSSTSGLSERFYQLVFHPGFALVLICISIVVFSIVIFIRVKRDSK